MINLHLPISKEDRNFLIECACDYTDEHLINFGTLPPAPLIAAHTATLVVRRNARPIGALTTAGGDGENGSPRSELHALYLLHRWRRKGYASAIVRQFAESAPHPAFLRGPLTPPLAHIAESQEIPTADLHDISMLDTVTDAFMNTVECHHSVAPCRSCVSVILRSYTVRSYQEFMHALEGGSTQS